MMQRTFLLLLFFKGVNLEHSHSLRSRLGYLSQRYAIAPAIIDRIACVPLGGILRLLFTRRKSGGRSTTYITLYFLYLFCV